MFRGRSLVSKVRELLRSLQRLHVIPVLKQQFSRKALSITFQTGHLPVFLKKNLMIGEVL